MYMFIVNKDLLRAFFKLFYSRICVSSFYQQFERHFYDNNCNFNFYKLS